MSIINRYLTREILKLFVIILALVVGIYVIVDFFEKVDNFIEKGVPVTRVFTFLFFKIPFIFNQILPVCVLLAVLVAFGLMNKNNEIIALKSCGLSVYYLLKPALVLGVLFTGLQFFMSEVIVPVTMARANHIWLKEVKKKPAVLTREKNIWMRGNRSITHIKYFHSAQKSLLGITRYRFDSNFRLTERIDAEKGTYRNDRWILYNVMEQKIEKGARLMSDMVFHEEKEVQLDFLPEDLKQVVKKTVDMNYMELKEFIRKVEEEGYDATAYRVDLYAKIASPFACIIMCLLATGISIRAKVREGLPVAVVYGLCVTFLYWVFYSFCVALGYGEMLPPTVAVWAANIVFLSFGMYTLLSAE
jgi:lipopolysaccharide export system permease protein